MDAGTNIGIYSEFPLPKLRWERSGKSELYLSDKLNVDHRAYMADRALRCVRGQPRFADNPDVKLLLQFWPYGLKQAGANWLI